jgi:hypothetical protein
MDIDAIRIAYRRYARRYDLYFGASRLCSGSLSSQSHTTCAGA